MADRTTRLIGDKITGLKGSHGGKRPGSGRPQGAIRRLSEQAILEAQQSGELPLDYMLRVMRDEGADDERRDLMAIAAAPYLHARLQRNLDARAGSAPLVGNLIVKFGGEENEANSRKEIHIAEINSIKDIDTCGKDPAVLHKPDDQH
jgi:hypothetical protein